MKDDFNPHDAINAFTKTVEDWYNTNFNSFRTDFEAAMNGLQDPSVGKDDPAYYDWKKNRTIKKFCKFLEEWFLWQPPVSGGLYYIEKFSWISYQNQAGLTFFAQRQGYQLTVDFTLLQGQYMDSTSSKPLVRKWEKELGPRMKEYVIPKAGFANFNEFFTREVKPGVRPIDAPEDDSVVSAPADCVINMIVDELTDTVRLPVKTVTMNVEQLLDGSVYAKNFVAADGRGGGTAVSCILLPDTYHWYHAPVTGQVVEAHDDVRGIYYGMKDFPGLLNKGNVGYGFDYSMFDDFRRGYLIIKTEKFGYVGMVPVGLNSIGSVQFLEKFKDISAPADAVPVAKGEKVGCFKYGGSLNILLFEYGKFPALRMLQGQRIGHLDAAPSSFFAHLRNQES